MRESKKLYDITLRVMVPQWLYDSLQHEAGRRGETLSAVVRSTLKQMFPREDPAQEKAEASS